MSKKYDLIVIGAGSGGLVAAETAHELGAKVALVEKNERLGGECLHAGCVPSKALIAAAHAAERARKALAFGVNADVKIDGKQVSDHIQAAISHIEDGGENAEHYRSTGIDVFIGAAKFTSKHSLEVGGEQISAKKFIIATGSSPLIPEITGLKDVNYDTNETIFDFQEIPARMAVIGGGPIGCELGQAFALLGGQVTILQTSERLLPREEEAVSRKLLKSFDACGIKTVLSMKITDISKTSGGISINYVQGEKKFRTEVDRLLVATGRKANDDLNLEAAGVKKNERGIVINAKLATTNKNIFAVGDCVGQYQFTHFAAEQAVMAVRNALFILSSKFSEKEVPWVTFTTPEIARLGPTSAELIKNNVDHKVHEINYGKIDKAITESQDGSIKVITDAKNKKILGAQIVGENAGEIIAQISLAYNNDLPFKALAKGMRAYPTYGIALKQLAGGSLLEIAANNRYLKLFRK